MAAVRPWLWWALGGALLLGGAASFVGRRYAPGSAALKQLLAAAAVAAGVPQAWAESPDLHWLVGEESGGHVGRPNYYYLPRSKNESNWPAIWAELRAGIYSARNKDGGPQTATGLGQLQVANVKKYYPAGLNGIGDPMNEAVGMLRYVVARYGNPLAARKFHQAHGWY